MEKLKVLEGKYAKQMEYLVKDKSRLPLYKALLCLPLNQIKRVDVHKGKDPSVEIHCYERPEDEFDDEEEIPYSDPNYYPHQIQLMFSGDMERQTFIDAVWESYEDGDDDDDEDGEDGEDDDVDSDDANKDD